MDEPLMLVLAAVVGAGLGVFFFAALWWTVRRLPDARRPGLLVMASFLGRMAVVMVGFIVVAGGRWERFVACLVGFLIARLAVVRRFGAAGANVKQR